MIARLNRVGRLQYELEEYVRRCQESGNAPSLEVLETLLVVAGK